MISKREIPEGFPDLITIPEFCSITRLSPSSVYRLRNAKRLPLRSVMIGRQVLFYYEEVRQWLDDGCPYNPISSPNSPRTA